MEEVWFKGKNFFLAGRDLRPDKSHAVPGERRGEMWLRFFLVFGGFGGWGYPRNLFVWQEMPNFRRAGRYTPAVPLFATNADDPLTAEELGFSSGEDIDMSQQPPDIEHGLGASAAPSPPWGGEGVFHMSPPIVPLSVPDVRPRRVVRADPEDLLPRREYAPAPLAAAAASALEQPGAPVPLLSWSGQPSLPGIVSARRVSVLELPPSVTHAPAASAGLPPVGAGAERIFLPGEVVDDAFGAHFECPPHPYSPTHVHHIPPGAMMPDSCPFRFPLVFP